MAVPHLTLPHRPVVLVAMPASVEAEVLPPRILQQLESTADVLPVRVRTSFDEVDPAILERAEVLVTGWDCPQITVALLERAPRVHTIVHTAGTVRTFIDDEVLGRVVVSTQATTNAIPVAEFTFAAVVLAAKSAFVLRERLRRERRGRDLRDLPQLGTYGSTVGVIGASRVGRLVLERLRTLDLQVLLSDPYLEPAEAAALGAQLVDLPTLMECSHIVTLHAPLLPETLGMITADLLALMPDGATFINTARGAIVDHVALEQECASGRLRAVLDVSSPEPLPPWSRWFELDNVFITPHISGSLGNEIARLGAGAVAEVARLARGEELRYALPSALKDRMA